MTVGRRCCLAITTWSGCTAVVAVVFCVFQTLVPPQEHHNFDEVVTYALAGGSVTVDAQAAPGLPPSPAHFCCKSKATCQNTTKMLPCVLWDETQAVYPSSQEKVLFLTTRATITKQSAPAGCDAADWGPECEWNTETSESVFVENAEEFTIRIIHGIIGYQEGVLGENTGGRAMKGKLVSAKDPRKAVLSWPK
eukprot:m.477751 g.477751  ORF g.477751 m.477751 type:complete len:194 (-) comp44842_c0_seq1:560-1141(-)